MFQRGAKSYLSEINILGLGALELLRYFVSRQAMNLILISHYQDRVLIGLCFKAIILTSCIPCQETGYTFNFIFTL